MEERKETGLSVDDINLFGEMADVLADVSGGEPTPGEKQDTDIIDNYSNDNYINNSDEDEDDESENDSEDTENTEDAVHDENDETTEHDDSSSPLIPYAKMLVEDSILPNLDIESFDGTADGLKNAMIGEITSGVNYYKDNLPPEIKSLINSYEAGVPFDEILRIKSDEIKFSNIKDEDLIGNDERQKEVMKEYYKRATNFKDDRINKSVDRLFENGELEEESKIAVKELVEFQAQEQAQAELKASQDYEAYQAQQLEQVEAAKNYAVSTEEFIPNVPVSKLLRDKIVRNMTSPVGYDDYGNPVSKLSNHFAQDPIKSEVFLNYLFEVTNGFSKFDVFNKVGKSKVMSELEDAARGLDAKNKGNGRSQGGSGNSKGFFGELTKMGF